MYHVKDGFNCLGNRFDEALRATFGAACWTLIGCGDVVDLTVRQHLAAGLHKVFAVLESHQTPVHDAGVGGVQGHYSLQG